MQRQRIHQLAAEIGFELAGVAEAVPSPDFSLFRGWVGRGFAGRMSYLTDRRMEARSDPDRLLSGVRTVVSVGKLYNGPEPKSTGVDDATRGWISRYAWGQDYHDVLRAGLEELGARIDAELPGEGAGGHRWRVLVDTAPLLERSYARAAGLGWIGKNTCLINEGRGSWFFLGELLTTAPIEPDAPPPERCGTCRRCIDACPTAAIVPFEGWWTVDSTACISYFTIELRGSIPEGARAGMGRHVFGCDICQDVCPWNRRAPEDRAEEFGPRNGELVGPPLERLAELTEQEFIEMFKTTPVTRARYQGFLRNVCVAMGNSGDVRHVAALERLAAVEGGDPVVAEHARWALGELAGATGTRLA